MPRAAITAYLFFAPALWPVWVPLAVVVAAGAAFAMSRGAFASVWCFFAAVLSLYLAYTLRHLRDVSTPESLPSETLAL